ncbi:MAG TPA: Gfo/Idh/MocA family oxidoreductase, partial [Verrucomicrobiota bacterium]|nr:Gfo/Idh/MocA family oxidoreductase [Verrucomicrobiota bacterium]
MDNSIKIALVGTGMFGGDVHARTYADLQRAGLSPQLGRVGLDGWARDFAPIRFELVAVAAHTEKSARRARQNFKHWTGHAPKAFAGRKPWRDILREFPSLDVMAVATPDPLHAEVILAAL